MAGQTLNTLVLQGITVVNDGMVAGGLRLGSETANAEPPALPFSCRHPSQGCLAEREPDVQRFQPADNGVDSEAFRAGRSDSRAGVPTRRSSARIAGGTVPYGWSPAMGVRNPDAKGNGPIKPMPLASMGNANPKGADASRRWHLPTDPILYRARGDKASELRGAGPAWSGPARTPSASTGGKGDR